MNLLFLIIKFNSRPVSDSVLSIGVIQEMKEWRVEHHSLADDTQPIQQH